MKTNWQTKKLGDIAKIQAGYGFPKNIQGKTSGDFPFIKVGDMNYQKQEIYLGISENYLDQNELKENGYKTIPAGTIIFPKIGGAIATNKKRILAVDSLYDNNVMGIIPTDIVLSEYLYYWLNTKNLSDWASGTSLPAINKSTIEAEEIPLPPLTIQHKIVTNLDEKFAKLREAKRLRQEAIGDTEKILAATLREIFEEGKERGWEEKSFDDQSILKMTSGGTPSRGNHEFYGGNIPWLKSGELQDNTNIVDSEEKITEKAVEKSSAKIFPIGTVLFAMYGATAGKIGILGIEASTNQAVAGMIPVAEKLDNKFLYYFLMKKREDIIAQAWGGAQPNLSQTILKRFSIPLPPLAEQQKIVTRLDALSEKLRTLRELQQSQLEDMKKLEKVYLREAFRGELV
jgi:type I restriction enzyme S subunit